MNNIKFAFLLVILFSIFGCTSDRHFEKYFSRNDGFWDIETLKWQRVESSITNQNISDGEVIDAGYLEFNESGNCKFSYSFDTFNRTGEAVWSAQDENIQLVYDNVTGGSTGAMIVSLRIDKSGPNQASLQGTETWNDNIGNSYSNTFSYELKRR